MKEKLRSRAIAILLATERYDSRGPRTHRARASLRQWLETGFYHSGYLAMATPDAACRWLEYVVNAERGRARLEAIRQKAQETEERL